MMYKLKCLGENKIQISHPDHEYVAIFENVCVLGYNIHKNSEYPYQAEVVLRLSVTSADMIIKEEEEVKITEEVKATRKLVL